MIIPADVFLSIVEELRIISDIMLQMTQHVYYSGNPIMPEHIMLELLHKMNVAIQRQHGMLQAVHEGQTA